MLRGRWRRRPHQQDVREKERRRWSQEGGDIKYTSGTLRGGETEKMAEEAQAQRGPPPLRACSCTCTQQALLPPTPPHPQRVSRAPAHDTSSAVLSSRREASPPVSVNAHVGRGARTAARKRGARFILPAASSATPPPGTDLGREKESEDQTVRTRRPSPPLPRATPHFDAYAMSPAGPWASLGRCAEPAGPPSSSFKKNKATTTTTQEHHQPRRGDSLTRVG